MGGLILSFFDKSKHCVENLKLEIAGLPCWSSIGARRSECSRAHWDFADTMPDALKANQIGNFGMPIGNSQYIHFQFNEHTKHPRKHNNSRSIFENGVLHFIIRAHFTRTLIKTGFCNKTQSSSSPCYLYADFDLVNLKRHWAKSSNSTFRVSIFCVSESPNGINQMVVSILVKTFGMVSEFSILNLPAYSFIFRMHRIQNRRFGFCSNQYTSPITFNSH